MEEEEEPRRDRGKGKGKQTKEIRTWRRRGNKDGGK